MSLDASDPLKIELSRAQNDRDRALALAAQWRRRYEVEAQQRRAEAEKADQTITALRTELFQLCQLGPTVRTLPTTTPMLSGREGKVEDESSSTLNRLNLEIAQLRQERDQLAQALAQEQAQHHKNRENLISALGEVLQRGQQSGDRREGT